MLDRFRQLSRVDVGDIRVWRGPEVTAQARRLGARGYTEKGEVYIPDEAGALEGSAAPLLAHELAHVVHQRTYGAALPAEGTTAGRLIEDEAIAVEQSFGGSAPLVHRHRQLAEVPELVAAGGVAAGLQRAVEFGDVADTAVRLSTTPEPISADFSSTFVAQPGVSQNSERLAEALRSLTLRETAVPEAGGASSPAVGPIPAAEEPVHWEALVGRLAEKPPRRWVDLDSYDDLEEIADRLYERLHRRFRLGLLIDRERSGTLTDFR
ncbi:DUF4157 domain-containing protein [Amycolatopsis sp. SID8362]|nr:DUF4157 domain-containing protein [Amycolatopsis sp. SID8362]NED42754.1 DUF4157 domain-containing protein [Amycolatopsis sp. SID8362]